MRLGVLCSNALSMASACAMAAVRAGANDVKLACYAGEKISSGSAQELIEHIWEGDK